MLGLQSYWDTAYADELTNFHEHGHTSEVRFGVEVMEIIVSWTKSLCIEISQGHMPNHLDEAIFLWRVDKKDFLLCTLTGTMTLFLGIEIGVLIRVSASLAFVIHKSTNPRLAFLGHLLSTIIYRNIQQYPKAYIYHGIVIVRIYFRNISCIKEGYRFWQDEHVEFKRESNSGKMPLWKFEVEGTLEIL